MGDIANEPTITTTAPAVTLTKGEEEIDLDVAEQADQVALQVIEVLISKFKEKTGRDPTKEEFENLVNEVTEERINDLCEGKENSGGESENEEGTGDEGTGDDGEDGDEEDGNDNNEVEGEGKEGAEEVESSGKRRGDDLLSNGDEVEESSKRLKVDQEE